jgi:hypothetical protein
MAWERLGQFKIGPQNIRELHVSNVYVDPEFITDVKNVPVDIKSITEKYAITTEDIDFYLAGNYPQYGFYRTRKKPFRMTGANNENIYLEVDINITKEDFNQIWKQIISTLKSGDNDGKFPKNKLPLYDKLLYAIFKARQNNESFVNIFKNYSSKKLPYFPNTVSGIDSEQKLKDYYYQFGPKIK